MIRFSSGGNCGSCTQFDPDGVDAFIRVIADGFPFAMTETGED